MYIPSTAYLYCSSLRRNAHVFVIDNALNCAIMYFKCLPIITADINAYQLVSMQTAMKRMPA